MDESVVQHLLLNDTSKLTVINYPYHVDANIFQEAGSLNEIVFIGWSFGVVYLNTFLTRFTRFQQCLSIGINGTPQIIGSYGITPKMYAYTLKNLTPVSRRLFFKNMGVTEDFVEPHVSLSVAKEAMIEFQQMPIFPNQIKFYILGTKDRIIPFFRQEKYVKKYELPYKSIEAPHYPFKKFRAWQEMVASGEEVL